MNELTIIIPFLNEGEEIDNTLKSIRETAKDKVDILIINDCSTDGYDYEHAAFQYQATYHKNSERLGVAASRDLAVSMIETDYFLLLDGHMRFYQDDWLEKTLHAVKQNSRGIYCFKCKNLLPDFSYDKSIDTIGAALNITTNENPNKILEPFWIYKDPDPEKSIVKIPCVLGASYVVHKNYWKYLRGLEGLRTYGNDEPFMSLKTWLEGGYCYLMKEVFVGHLFRETPPFPMNSIDRIYNKLLIAELLLPVSIKKEVSSKLNQSFPDRTRGAMSLLVSKKDFIIDTKKYLQKIFTRDFESFLQFNNSV